VDEGRACTRPGTKPYYYFFRDPGNVTEARALRALLHQYFVAHPAEISFALDTYRNLRDQLKDSASQLWELLIDDLVRSNGNETIIILDALDECIDVERNIFIGRIVKLYRHAGLIRTLKLKILITSRPYPDIEDEFDFPLEATEFLHFEGEFETEAITKDVNTVLETRLPRVTKGLSTSQRQRLLEALQATPNRTYLWVRLILDRLQDQLRNCLNDQQRNRLIHDTPRSLDGIYSRMLDREQAGDTGIRRSNARTLLQILVAADRPLIVHEVLEACTIYWDVSSRSWPETDAAALEAFGRTLRSILNLMVMVHDDKVYFIHATAREFLLKGQDKIEPSDWHEW